MKDNLMIPVWWLQSRYYQLRSRWAVRQINKLNRQARDDEYLMAQLRKANREGLL